MYYLVYKITNKINGNSYIGCHKTRNVDDGYMGSGVLIRKAINKYGVENFNKEILFSLDNSEDMFFLEEVCINEQSPEYNLCAGGKGGWDYVNRTGKAVSLKIQQEKYIKEWGKRHSKRCEERYYKNPDRCRVCDKVLEYKHITLTCSKECSSKLRSYNNSQRILSDETKKKISNTLKKKRKKCIRKCSCGKQIKKTNKSGFCKDCFIRYRFSKKNLAL